jgi:tagatose 1,6-diphosphate aldolase
MLPYGKYRNLSQCSTKRGAISVMALDHRQNLRAAINPTDPSQVNDSQLIEFKRLVVSRLAPVATAVLLDAQYGAAHCIASRDLPGTTGLLVAAEATGYTGDPTARTSRILAGWSMTKASGLGANAVKLLAYYHPQSPTAGQLEELIRQVAEDCNAVGLPLFLEPLSYSLDPSSKKLAPQERCQVVIETARRLTAIPGVDILKAEFPLDIDAVQDEHAWADACAQLSAASQAPWVLLSASANYETFLRMVTVACQHGASGVAVGRAVWQEAPKLTGAERVKFIEQVAVPRMQRITALCDALAKPWMDFYPLDEPKTDWYL